MSNFPTTPLVSVLIPAYNHQDYIQETIKSVINQHYNNIEIIIIDDGSQDETFNKIIEMENACQKRFKKTTFLSQQNIGTALTLNRLIEMSSGDYIGLMASDDLYKNIAIEHMVDFLEANADYVLAVGDNDIINSKSERVYWGKKRETITIEKKAKYTSFAQTTMRDGNFSEANFGTYESILRGNYIPNGYLIRKNAIHKINQFNHDAPLEDWYLHLQLSKLGRYKYFNQIMASYRWHDKNVSHDKAKLAEMGKKTIQHEMGLVKKNDDKYIQQCWSSYIAKSQYSKKYGIPFLFEFIKKKNRMFETRYISINVFGVSFMSYEERYPTKEYKLFSITIYKT